jgi:hypothetical protein
LIAHFEAHADRLDDDAKRRLHSNPLRILDSKNPAMQAIVEAAPKLMDFLGAASLAHLDGVRAILDAVGLAYRINPRLVRGLDYYNLTVFEWVTDRLGSQSAVCAGGRYDPLIAHLGGKPAPAVGWGMGIERVLLLLQEAAIDVPQEPPRVFAVVPGPAASPTAMRICERLRAAGRLRFDACGRRERLGQRESAVPARRCERGAACADLRRRRAGARRSRLQAPARCRMRRSARCASTRSIGGPRNSSHNLAFTRDSSMATHLDLEEQEQLDQLKAFWKQYGNLVTWALIAVLAAFAAWNGWNWWQRDQAVKAGAMFDELESAAGTGDAERAAGSSPT